MASKTGASSTSNTKSQAGRTCLCSPTTHRGSFRCSRHKHKNPSKPADESSGRRTRRVPVSSNLDLSVIAKANSIKDLLLHMILIKPSSHDLQRRRSFQPKPSRFCVLNGNGNMLGVAVS